MKARPVAAQICDPRLRRRAGGIASPPTINQGPTLSGNGNRSNYKQPECVSPQFWQNEPMLPPEHTSEF
jgi:hypothetical protein